MRVNITVVTHGRLPLTRVCLESLLPTVRGKDVRVTVVDNASKDGSREYLQDIAARHEAVRLHRFERNMGVAVAANYGWADADADYFMKLDNDIEILRPDWLEKLLAVMDANPCLGLAGYCHCAWHERTPVRLPSGHEFLESPGCNGACILIPRHIHAEFGFWNEDYGLYGYEDLDYNVRVLHRGYRIGYVDDDAATRHLGAVRAGDDGREAAKKRSIASVIGGEKLYLLNKFLFEEGVRDMNVPRKYLPETREGRPRFHLNGAYKPILRLQQELLAKVGYTVDGDRVSLDLSAFKSALRDVGRDVGRDVEHEGRGPAVKN